MDKAVKISLQDNLNDIIRENQHVIDQLDFHSLAMLIEAIRTAKRIFVVGAGRTGLALKMVAMRFMHLGYSVHVVGETTTPAILEGDLLLLGSGSGTTSTLVVAAEKAQKQGATIVLLTANQRSTLANLANHMIWLPAAVKTDFGTETSKQYAGSLFEQAVLLVLDGVFMSLWKASGLSKEELWPQHANLE